MYRLLLYYLLGLLAAAIVFSSIGVMNYNGFEIGISAGVLVGACWVINKIFASIFNAPTNPESSILTGLILALVIPPTFNNFGFLFMLAASGLAIASKYILTIRYKHIFNPAAIAIVLTALGPRQSASWWVGTAAMLPLVIIGGILVMRKIRRESMVIMFLVTTTAATALFATIGGASALTSLREMALTSSAFFLGFVMLTEPYTSPTTLTKQLWYAAIVGVLLTPQTHIGHYYTSPEVALIIGNLFAYVVSSKTKLFPILREKIEIAANTFEFRFMSQQKLAYEPGQYMEWTLPHDNTDDRGARRWFTLASSPTENSIKIGVKFYDKGSSYKDAMLTMDQNTPIVASQLAGDFVMPKDTAEKLVFIAGGIGVTPFRSMIKYLIDMNQERSVRMLYSARSHEGFAYKDVFEEARRKLGINTMYVTSRNSTTKAMPHTIPGPITGKLITRVIPDYADCMFYISGTRPMVEDIQEALEQLHVPLHRIKVDFFQGYA